MSDEIDCVIIGAGVIGLAIGRELALAGREVIVVERNAGVGEETSSRNSEVIHAGIYYPTSSLKARLCVSGKSMLYEYCQGRQIPFRRIGKLIVATDDSQLGRLTSLKSRATQNGVTDIEEIDRIELERREPNVRGVAALWSPSTGIIDSHALMLALQADLETAGGIVATHSAIEAIDVGNKKIDLRVASGDDSSELTATTVINAAGLGALSLAKNCTGVDSSAVPRGYLAKGSYFVLDGPSPFKTLVYPLPVAGGLGIHATLDLAGKLRFGPDVEWLDEIDYSVDAKRRDAFAESIQHYWPELNPADLVPGYAGIRPKLSGPGEPPADFCIEPAATSAARQLIHLFGFESPGLTAALAIAEEVKNLVAVARS